MAAESPKHGTAVRFALLALLADEPAHGYALKGRFEAAVGGVWPLNIGQVYDALAKLERDGLVEAVAERDGTRQAYRATSAGEEAAAAWLVSPPPADVPPRDELAMRLLFARVARGADVGAVIQRQREAALARIQGLGRQRTAALDAGDEPRALLLDLLLLRADADARWLTHLDARLAAATRTESR
jgi:DNA-binding PadR family transcriptional regulator